MKNHLRANAWLLLLSVVVLCLIYPAVLWSVASLFFRESAAGSMIVEKTGDTQIVRGSSLIAQPFTKDGYFQPRPSAASFNATASGASNWGASNPKLRDRVARQLGPIVKYNPYPDGTGRETTVQKDIESWFVDYRPKTGKPALIVAWAKEFPTLAAAWIKNDANKAATIEWLERHPRILEEWRDAKLAELRKSDPDATVAAPDLNDDATIPFDDIATVFFESVAATPEFKNRWLEPEEYEKSAKDEKGEVVKGKRFKPIAEGADLQSTFFDLWLQAHPDADLKKAPADMVMASGSGLDPHITLRNAEYQLESVAAARSPGKNPSDVRRQIGAMVKEHSFTPLSGLIGEPLVNVLELNLALDKQFPLPPKAQ